MENIPKRPELTRDLILLALETNHNNKKDEWDFDTIARNYHQHMDGYHLMRELESNAWWDGSRELMEDLDEVCWSIDSAHKKAQLDWQKAYDIKPKLPIGHIFIYRGKKAQITGIYKHDAARYLVQFRDCESTPLGGGSHLLLNFEVVEALC